MHETQSNNRNIKTNSNKRNPTTTTTTNNNNMTKVTTVERKKSLSLFLDDLVSICRQPVETYKLVQPKCTIVLTGGDLTIDDLRKIMDDDEGLVHVEIAPEAMKKIQTSRSYVEKVTSKVWYWYIGRPAPLATENAILRELRTRCSI